VGVGANMCGFDHILWEREVDGHGSSSETCPPPWATLNTRATAANLSRHHRALGGRCARMRRGRDGQARASGGTETDAKALAPTLGDRVQTTRAWSRQRGTTRTSASGAEGRVKTRPMARRACRARPPRRDGRREAGATAPARARGSDDRRLAEAARGEQARAGSHRDGSVGETRPSRRQRGGGGAREEERGGEGDARCNEQE
jgi:hypothetical protein